MGLRLSLVASHLGVYRRILDFRIPGFQRHSTETMGHFAISIESGTQKAHPYTQRNELCSGSHSGSQLGQGDQTLPQETQISKCKIRQKSKRNMFGDSKF